MGGLVRDTRNRGKFPSGRGSQGKCDSSWGWQQHAEEALIVAAAGDGITLDRRPHANPLAVLGVTFDRAAATARAS